MESNVKTYFLVPNLDIPPPSKGSLDLGSIITHPKSPLHILTEGNHNLPQPNDVHTSYKEDYVVRGSELHQGKASIWASLLAIILGIRGRREGTTEHDTDVDYVCNELMTTYFQPEDEYIFQALQIPSVKSYITKSFFREPVYMITGLKIACGALAVIKDEGPVEGKQEVHHDETRAGASASGGSQTGPGVQKKKYLDWRESRDFVYAYQVVKIKSKKKEGEFKEKDFNKGASLYADDDANVEGESVEDLHKSWDVGNDEGTLHREFKREPAVDDDGLDCFIVVG